MATASETDWRDQFAISDWMPPTFFASKDALDKAASAVPQAHGLRRAFEAMKLDGIVCFENSPVIYFKELPRLDPDLIRPVYSQFWNQGIAPVLVLIGPRAVQIYSGLTEPLSAQDNISQASCFIRALDRVAEANDLREFVLSVESGDFFRVHHRSFDPKQRVDRNLLRNLEQVRKKLTVGSERKLDPEVTDALLCRLVFTCYLFDREVIDSDYLQELGIDDAAHLRDILGRMNKVRARDDLYRLFKRLGRDFNGDLFRVDLDGESNAVLAEHLTVLDQFFRATEVKTGQQSFWPYDFSVIPIETISAIYEHFLKASGLEKQQAAGAFYTPRFLAELVIDTALHEVGSLLDKRFLDPSCGSGIFLVGLFNRLAEEWKRTNPGARYDRQVDGLMRILKENLFGVDQNPTACRIAAFSLYLALLDKLSPPDIRQLQRKGKLLPPLIALPGEPPATIACGNFFDGSVAVPVNFHIAVGNPPWTSMAGPESLAEEWCRKETLPLANRQLALAFIWKAPRHLQDKGHVTFVLPHGVLFNHQAQAIRVQRAWLTAHALELVVNLADYQRFLFEVAEAPAVIARYRKGEPDAQSQSIRYLTPKTDWTVSQAEIITVFPDDQKQIALSDLLAGLRPGADSLVWKVNFWATPRDRILLDRLGLYPRLSVITRQPRESAAKPWFAAQGFIPEAGGEKRDGSKRCPWPAETLFLDAKSDAIDLVVLEEDCKPLAGQFPWLYRLPQADIFAPPHVLVSQGMHVAYSGFPVVFRHALQGIHGPAKDAELLMFLAAYLRSPVARYFLFHTSSNWGVSRAKVHLQELLRVPFPLPEQTAEPARAAMIVREVAALMRSTAKAAGKPFTDREGLIRNAKQVIDPLVYEYFDINDIERALVEDTNAVAIPSSRPSRASAGIPTLQESTEKGRTEYTTLVCERLNNWARKGNSRVRGRIATLPQSGVGLVEFEKIPKGDKPTNKATPDRGALLALLHRLEKSVRKDLGRIELARDLKVFDRNRLYVVKPLNRRFWTRTAAINDADEIAGTILMHSLKEDA